MTRAHILVLLAIALPVNAESPGDFAYRIPLTVEGNAAFYRIELPAPVYEGRMRRDLGDLRVFNRDGEAVAFAFLPRPAVARASGAALELPYFPLRAESTRQDVGDLAITLTRTAAGTTVNLATRDGRIVAAERLIGYLVDARDAKEALAALTLAIPQGANVTTRMRVESSEDLVAWRTIASGAPILSLEFAGRRLTRDRIEIAPTNAKFFRITFEAGQPTPEFASVRAESSDRPLEAPRQWRDVAGMAVRDAPGNYEFDLGGTFPVDRVTLLLPEMNTVAPAELLVRASTNDEWRPITSAVFYRLRQDSGETVSPPLAVGNGTYRYWQVRIDPKAGGIGTESPRLSFGWYPGAIVFAARGNAPFELAYGNARVAPASLPIETLVPGYDGAKRESVSFPSAHAGSVNAAPSNRMLEEPLDTKRWLLWASLALGASVLGWMAYSLSRQMRKPISSNADEPPSDAR